jgi:hypothetical protein
MPSAIWLGFTRSGGQVRYSRGASGRMLSPSSSQTVSSFGVVSFGLTSNDPSLRSERGGVNA